jgi:dihydroneopterin aldolase
MAIIQIENMEFYAYHGCFQEEQVVGNQFLVNILVEVDTPTWHNNPINYTIRVNYQVIYNLVKE